MQNDKPGGRVAAVTLACSLLLIGGCSRSGRNADLPPYPHVAGLTFPQTGPQALSMRAVPAYAGVTTNGPLFVTTAGDGSRRLFVVEQRGQILVFPDDDTVTDTAVSLFLRLQPQAGGEEGLLGLAFDPAYKTNGYFYVYYTAPNPRRSVISRFSVSAGNVDQADAASEKILLTIPQPYGNHNGGMLAFGADGYLYIALGDGGSAGDPHGHGQDLSTLLGSILRIDPHGKTGSLAYGIPSDNPFVGQAGARGEIWAYGLRNVWRMAFDPVRGELWAGDVGQGQREEIDIIRKGGNYGWNWLEGTRPYQNGAPAGASFVAPVHDYQHSEGRSVTGGYVYRGSAFAELQGAYLFGDFVSGRVWALVRDGAGRATVVQIAQLDQLASFGVDADGEVLLVSLSRGIHRLQRRDPNLPSRPFPKLLSETGLFLDTAALTPAARLLPYQVNEEFYSDGATKQRWLALPNRDRVGFRSVESFRFPVGSVLVKHFELAGVRLETRVLVRGAAGWSGHVYAWNDQGTDANLLTAAATREVDLGGGQKQTWEYPSPADCFACHVSGREVLGAEARQLQRMVRYRTAPEDKEQLRSWGRLGMFNGPISTVTPLPASKDVTVSLERRARSYLHVNCAMCHQPGGSGGGTMDLRFTTPLAQTGILDVAPENGDLGVAGARILKPGNKALSLLWLRLQRTDDKRMPPVGSRVVDQAGSKLIGDWIDGL